MSQPALQGFQLWWSRLAARERQGVVMALACVGLALVWFVLLAPALRTLAQAPQSRARLDAQVQAMQSLQLQARALQAQPVVGAQESLRALQASAASLGPTARLQVLGDQVTLVLQQTPASQLAPWLAASRTQLPLPPQQVHLQRSPEAATWSGTLVFNLPGNGSP